MNHTALLPLPENGKLFVFVRRRLSAALLRLWVRAVGLLALGAMLLPVPAGAGLLGTTGKVSGTVTDAGNKEPLIGASVLLEGTKFGARTDIEGNYNILNIPPGTYRVKASYVGYQDKIVGNIKVGIDLTTRLDFELGTKEVSSTEIVITAERPVVTKDLTNTQAVVSSDEIKALPIQDFNQVVELQAGVVGGNFRGGRKGEVAYLVDGISVTDVYNGNQGRENSTGIEPNAIQEIQVISGAFNAEYGQAMSGIVNVVTKEGASRYSGGVSLLSGDYLTSRTNRFPNITNLNPLASRVLDANLNGPVPGISNLTFFVNGRYQEDEGRFYGQRVFRNGDIIPTNSGLTEPLGRLNNYLSQYGEIRTSEALDQFFTRAYNGGVPGVRFENGVPQITVVNGQPYEILQGSSSDFRKYASGDGSYVAMNPYRKYSGLAKMTFRPSGSFNTSGQVFFSDESFKNFGENYDWQYIPDNVRTNFRRSITGLLNATHTVNTNLFYTVGVLALYSQEQNYLYEDPFDPRYFQTPPSGNNPFGAYKPNQTQQGLEFLVSGAQDGSFKRSTLTYTGKIDATFQADNINQFKGGIEAKVHRLELLNQGYVWSGNFNVDTTASSVLPNLTLDPRFGTGGVRLAQLADQSGTFDQYLRRPVEFSAYLQDKAEFKTFIVNFGLRLDVFSPDGIVPKDLSDPGIYTPIRDENLPQRADGTPNRNPTREDLAANGERLLANNYTAASIKYQISPRFGISFPITDRGIVHFSYGQFFQIPNFELLYRNPYFTKASGASFSGPFGNADLKPQKTTSAELGVQQQFGNDIGVELTLYLRDIRDLTGSAFTFTYFGGNGNYTRFVNTDFGLVRGLILSVSKRFSNTFNFSADYTFQVADGNSSDPATAANAIASGNPVPTLLFPLDWDQSHTLNITSNYEIEGWQLSAIGRFGSGFPFTPDPNVAGLLIVGSRGEVLTNISRKLATFSLDIRAQKTLTLFEGLNASVFVQIYNLLDTENQNGLYNGLLTPDLLLRSITTASSVNSTFDFLRRPDYFSEPRKVLFGLNLFF